MPKRQIMKIQLVSIHHSNFLLLKYFVIVTFSLLLFPSLSSLALLSTFFFQLLSYISQRRLSIYKHTYIDIDVVLWRACCHIGSLHRYMLTSEQTKLSKVMNILLDMNLWLKHSIHQRMPKDIVFFLSRTNGNSSTSLRKKTEVELFNHLKAREKKREKFHLKVPVFLNSVVIYVCVTCGWYLKEA